MKEEIALLVRGYSERSLPATFVFAGLFRLMAQHGIPEVAAEVPEGLLRAFVRWAREIYDNDTPIANLVWLPSSPEPPGARSLVPALRDWLRQQGD